MKRSRTRPPRLSSSSTNGSATWAPLSTASGFSTEMRSQASCAFGRTAGTKTAESVCGAAYASMVKTLCRGACVHWAHPNSASFLISRACRLMSQKGFHIFVAYSDAEAGEIGTVYQASNWLHCEPTKQGSSMFVWTGEKVGGFKDGRLRDERCISAATRMRTSEKGAYRVRCSRRVLRERMVEEGFLFLKGTPKRRYVNICAGGALRKCRHPPTGPDRRVGR